MLNYARAFEEDYGLRFIDVRIAGIVEDVMYSDVFPANSRTTSIRYVVVRNMMRKDQELLPLLGNLGNIAPVDEILGIMILDLPSLYIPSEENILLKIQTAHAFVKNAHKSTSCHTSAYCNHTRHVLNEPHPHHLEQEENNITTFAVFLDTGIQ